VNLGNLIRPPENVVPADEQNEEQQHERDGKKRDVPLEESYYRSRPARGRNALHRDEHDSG
jgi:hypothetical protein